MRKYGDLGLYLLLPPSRTITKSSNQFTDETSSEDDYNYTYGSELSEGQDGWSMENIIMETHYFKQDSIVDTLKQRKAWVKYLEDNGYSPSITDYIYRHELKIDPLRPNNIEVKAASAINAIGHEYNRILRDFELWIISLLQNDLEFFTPWRASNLDYEDIKANFKFTNWRNKIKGTIKAWHDGCSLSPDGLKIKEPVYLSFIDFISYKYQNETSDWSYISQYWTIGGYSSELEEKIGTITQEGMKWILGPEATPKRIGKIGAWMINNVFSICGIF